MDYTYALLQDDVALFWDGRERESTLLNVDVRVKKCGVHYVMATRQDLQDLVSVFLRFPVIYAVSCTCTYTAYLYRLNGYQVKS